MANSDYTWSDVLAGNGTLSINGGLAYSAGVLSLQTFLHNIGYDITPDGQFGSGTDSAVKQFQHELGITEDGIVGIGTANRLNTVRYSQYYTVYGKRLTASQWGQSVILTGNFTDANLLSRIIFAEDMNSTDAQNGIAIVIKKRKNSNSSLYMESSSAYPNASAWARVIGKSGAYSTASSSNANARTPRRGLRGYSSDNYVDPYWKHAVETAIALVNGTSFSATGKKIVGTTITNTNVTVTSSTSDAYYYQCNFSAYTNWYNSGLIDTSVVPIAFSSQGGTTVICKRN